MEPEKFKLNLIGGLSPKTPIFEMFGISDKRDDEISSQIGEACDRLQKEDGRFDPQRIMIEAASIPANAEEAAFIYMKIGIALVKSQAMDNPLSRLLDVISVVRAAREEKA